MIKLLGLNECFKDLRLSVTIFILDWELVAEKKECSGWETNQGYKRTIEQCADACRGKTSMFIFGTNDFGGRRCYFPCRGCQCYCEYKVSGAPLTSGVCDQVDHNGFRLYSLGDDNDDEADDEGKNMLLVNISIILSGEKMLHSCLYYHRV